MQRDSLIGRSIVLHEGPLASEVSVNRSKLQKAFRREFPELCKFLTFVEGRSGYAVARAIWLRLWSDMQEEYSLGLDETVEALAKLSVPAEILLANDPLPADDPVEYWFSHLDFLISVGSAGCET